MKIGHLLFAGQTRIEIFIIRILILAGVVISSITTLAHIIAIKGFELSATIGVIAMASMAFCYLLTRFNKVTLAGLITTSILLILMSMEIAMSQFLRHSSMATLVVLAFSNSAAYQRATRVILHLVTFFTLLLWILLLNSDAAVLPDGSSFLGMGIHLLGIYILLAFVTYIFKKRYDRAIVELQNTLKELKNAESQLVLSEKLGAMGVLTAGMAHEINNPLNFIHAGTKLLEDIFKKLKGDSKEKVSGKDLDTIPVLIGNINLGTDRIRKIVMSLNSFSENVEQKDAECDVHEILENTLTILHHEYENRITISKEYAKEDLKVWGNESHLYQVFTNVLMNAIQAIDKHGQITIQSSRDRDEVKVHLSDTGSGIPEQILDKIYDPFFTTKDAGEGVGLGLSIVYNIMKSHGGDISFESVEGKGTCVCLRFQNSV